MKMQGVMSRVIIIVKDVLSHQMQISVEVLKSMMKIVCDGLGTSNQCFQNRTGSAGWTSSTANWLLVRLSSLKKSNRDQILRTARNCEPVGIDWFFLLSFLFQMHNYLLLFLFCLEQFSAPCLIYVGTVVPVSLFVPQSVRQPEDLSFFLCTLAMVVRKVTVKRKEERRKKDRVRR